jgi:hypothetical protein
MNSNIWYQELGCTPGSCHTALHAATTTVTDYCCHLQRAARIAVTNASLSTSSSTGIIYPTLTRMNYTEWSFVMKVNLQVAGLWDVIEDGDGDYHNDRAILTAILRAMPLEM